MGSSASSIIVFLFCLLDVATAPTTSLSSSHRTATRGAFSAKAQCPRQCGDLPSNIVVVAWITSGVNWGRGLLSHLHSHCGYREPQLVHAGASSSSSSSSSSWKFALPPKRGCSLIAVQNGLLESQPKDFFLWSLDTFTPKQLRLIHIIREPFEFVVSACTKTSEFKTKTATAL